MNWQVTHATWVTISLFAKDTALTPELDLDDIEAIFESLPDDPMELKMQLYAKIVYAENLREMHDEMLEQTRERNRQRLDLMVKGRYYEMITEFGEEDGHLKDAWLTFMMVLKLSRPDIEAEMTEARRILIQELERQL